MLHLLQKNISRFFAGIMAVVLLSFSIIPASAADVGLVGTVQSFVEWSVNKQNDFANSFWKAIFGDSFNAEDFTPGGKYGGGAGRDELQAAYDAYVSDLPAIGYTSSGGLSWKIVPYLGYVSGSNRASGERLTDYVRAFGQGRSGVSTFVSFILLEDFVAPIDGTYNLSVVTLDSHLATGSGRSSLHNFNKLLLAGEIVACAGTVNSDGVSILTVNFSSMVERGYWYGYIVISCVPHAPLGTDIYNINTRPTSITGGNYGIVGDNGQITKVEGNTIVNETNNTVWNPVTGFTSNITDWSYDYSTRTYIVTLENGTTQTITYGDENITIQEGDTVYNVYYLIDSGSTEENPSCDHVWMETDRTEPTCTIAGQASSTCSKCGQSKTDPIPALGHDWQVKQTVTTEYDDTGQLVQEGYTIFECSRCQEQYKSTDGTAPPDKPPDSGEEDGEKKGFFAWLWDVLTDSLKKLIEGIIDAILKTLGFFFGGDGQSNADFYNNPSTFSGVSVWD